MKPAARTDLALRDLDDEAVVYDFRTQEAHCLNATALAIFRLSDGTRTVAQLAKQASAQLGASVDEDLVWMALAELDRAQLLSTPLPRKQPDFSRRLALKKMALTAGVALALPAVWSIVAPTPAYAASSARCTNPNACMGNGHVGECCGSSGQSPMTCLSNGTCSGAPGSSCPTVCK